MSLTSQVGDGLTRLTAEINAVRDEAQFALDGHLLEIGQTEADIPAGLPVGSLVFRKA